MPVTVVLPSQPPTAEAVEQMLTAQLRLWDSSRSEVDLVSGLIIMQASEATPRIEVTRWALTPAGTGSRITLTSDDPDAPSSGLVHSPEFGEVTPDPDALTEVLDALRAAGLNVHQAEWNFGPGGPTTAT